LNIHKIVSDEQERGGVYLPPRQTGMPGRLAYSLEGEKVREKVTEKVRGNRW